MGYKRCGVPGCRTGCGSGKRMRGFPKHSNLQQLWIRELPLGFKITANSAICEDHFEAHCFERPRQDGKTRLKDDAVPTLWPELTPKTRKRPFGDVTNICSLNSSLQISKKGTGHVEGSFHYSPFIHDKENTAVEGLVMLGTLGVSSKDMTIVDKVESEQISLLVDQDGMEGAQPDQGSLVMANVDVDLDLATENDPIDQGCMVLNDFDRTLELTPELPTTPTSVGLSDHEREIYFTANWSNGSIILDEVSGEFTLPNPASEATNDVTSEANSYETLKIGAFDHIMDLCTRQQTELEKLREENEELQQKVEDLIYEQKFSGNFSTDFYHKYEAMRKSKERLEQRTKRDDYSPWLSEDQMKRLRRGSNRGLSWKMSEIRDGLILKMQCGTSGYSAVVNRFPFLLPAVRTLQETVQFIKFDSGILDSVFDLLEVMMRGMKEKERDCVLVLDEMAIQEGERLCNSLKKWVGAATLPTHCGLGSKALTFLLAGVTKRWKISVAVYFTSKRSPEVLKQKNKNLTGEAYSKIIDSVISKASDIGANVVCVCSDMGADNLALWKEKGVTGGKGKEVASSFPHPSKENAEVFVLPDVVHLMKSIKAMLESNKVVTLPSDVVEEEGLFSSEVSYKHIEDLYEFESNNELKVAFRLKEANIRCTKQFKKMQVGTAKAVLCHRTGVGLKLMAQEINDPSYETTGWFIILLNTFFELSTARYKGLAVSKLSYEVFEKAIALIKKVEHIFHNMKVGNGGEFKPVQRGIRILCASQLKLIDYFLGERQYEYLMLGRFTSDCIENLFSLVRLSQPVPHAVAFLQILKVITLAQFSTAVKGSSYEYEECSPLTSTDFLEEARRRARERATTKFYDSLEELFQHPIRKLNQVDFKMLNEWEKMIIYDMAGSTVAALLKSNMTVCDQCIEATKWKDTTPHPASLVTEMKEFTILRSDGAPKLQISVSQEIYEAILTAEVSFRLFREKTIGFQTADVQKYFIENLMYVWNGSSISQCHNLGRKILTVFFDSRLKQFQSMRKEKVGEVTRSVPKSSKSVCMRAVADQISSNSQKL